MEVQFANERLLMVEIERLRDEINDCDCSTVGGPCSACLFRDGLLERNERALRELQKPRWPELASSKENCVDPGTWLLRFPFSLLPARRVLSERAMRLVTLAFQAGYRGHKGELLSDRLRHGRGQVSR